MTLHEIEMRGPIRREGVIAIRGDGGPWQFQRTPRRPRLYTLARRLLRWAA